MKAIFKAPGKDYELEARKFTCNRFGIASKICRFLSASNERFPSRALDVGCGVGPISIWLAEQFRCNVDAVDLNDIACKCCRRNVGHYGVRDFVKVYGVNFADFSIPEGMFYDLIVSNPPLPPSQCNRSDLPSQSITMDSERFSWLTNGWHDDAGRDLCDLIFEFAAKKLCPTGSVIMGICDVEVPTAPEFIVMKGKKHDFHATRFFSEQISPEELGVESFHPEGVKVWVIEFRREKIKMIERFPI